MKTKYYGVIGNRDHIKINKGTPEEDKRPFWEFLDQQPDGWLTSLAYKRKDYPEDRGQMIWDCGAWSYKNEETPKLGSNLVTPEWVIEEYLHHATAGDLLVAPDHMLIEGHDLDYRRKLNAENAVEFLTTCPDGFNPMAVIHGMDEEERVNNAIWLAEIGYKHLSVGGVAARASQKRQVVESVARIRKVAPDIWLHVLGLSSPPYLRAWTELGVQSCDGSSHFKQAFTGGAFFTVEDGKLKKHQAARTDRTTGEVIEEIVAPLCNCKSCSRLREDGIDTRTYGSNENNMGRAAHNMNKLMEAQQCELSASYLV